MANLTNLYVIQGDKLEFDFIIKENCQTRPLYDGESLFFEVLNAGAEYNVVQTDHHFTFPHVNLSPGNYPFRAGLIFADGTTRTFFPSTSSQLAVAGR